LGNVSSFSLLSEVAGTATGDQGMLWEWQRGDNQEN
jgi:hypothetical protein